VSTGPLKGIQLRFDAGKVRDGAHGEEQLFEEPLGDGILRDFGPKHRGRQSDPFAPRGRKMNTRQPCRFRTPRIRPGVRVQEPFNEFERAAVVPMQFVAPVPRFLFEQRLNLADGGLSQIDDVHGWPETSGPCRANTIIADSLRPSGGWRAAGDTNPTQGEGVQAVGRRRC